MENIIREIKTEPDLEIYSILENIEYDSSMNYKSETESKYFTENIDKIKCESTSDPVISQNSELSLSYTIDEKPEEKQFKCDLCDKSFVRNQSLKKHMLIHSGVKLERPKKFKCDLCDKSFSDSSKLTIHKVSHTGEKPFKCELCNKGFVSNSGLKLHKFTHSDDKPFKCDLCDKKFSGKSKLATHKLNYVHNSREKKCVEKRFKCDLCDNRYFVTSRLRDHRLTHLVGKKPYKCDLCDNKGFAHKAGLTRHKLSHHNGLKPFAQRDENH